MPDIWPLEAKRHFSNAARDLIRPFKCLILMPFEGRFDAVAQTIRETVEEVCNSFPVGFHLNLPQIQRLDWVTSTGVIQQELWREIDEADLIFCDITGYNPNVMFELGVCTAWKEMKQVVLIKDQFFKQPSAFDIAPIRYTEYQLTSEGLPRFKELVQRHTVNVLVGFPDLQGSAPEITFPLEMGFKTNCDDLRLYTPPYSHRRVIDGAVEFGSRSHFPHSWASVGKTPLLNFALRFSARFSHRVDGSGSIGVGLRSQHYYANFGHIVYLNYQGQITIATPTEEPPNFYKDITLRPPTPIDLIAYHDFDILFNQSVLEMRIDDFHHIFQISELPKVFGPGLIRFQSHMSWMAIKNIVISNVSP